jgi:acetoacetyl-CoA synthetase
MARFMRYLATERGLRFADYHALWRWSVSDLEAFWQSVWAFFDVRARAAPESVLGSRAMPGARWFPGATLSYAEHALRREDDALALLACDESGARRALTRRELRREVARVAAGLRTHGVGVGDRVAAVLPNTAEAVVAFLATASLGATWSSCSPEFGARSVLDRFRQIEPKVLLAVDGHVYAGRRFDRRSELAEVRAGLPGLAATVVLDRLEPDAAAPAGTLAWANLPREGGDLDPVAVPFDHPLWILYSSGTTGLPKPIVQGHGGILLEHLKALALHGDVREGDRLFWYTTTGWMMWNFIVSGLLVGATVVLYDGSPGWPDLGTLWRLAGATRMTCFGVSAPYLMACRKAGVVPSREADLEALQAVGSTGAPLPPEGFAWVYENVKRDVMLASISGGTDACTAFVGSCPLLPVHAGEIQCRYLGAAVAAFDPEGRPVTGEVGELVLTQPLPSMPLCFWGDRDGRRYREAYFETYPGTWRHGDWIKLTPRGSAVISGRSDSTLNRGGVRIGTAELYRVVESIPAIADSVVVDTGSLGQEGRLLLFVVMRPGATLDDATRDAIRSALRTQMSPRHVPDEIHAIPEVPRTLNGKKLEVPIKRILTGTPPERAVNRDTLANPAALDPFVKKGV